MEFFTKPKAVKLRCHNNKYLVADGDQKSIRQSRNYSSARSRWIVELVDGGATFSIRLKSCYGLYLTATGEPFLLGMTGNKVVQSQPANLKEMPIKWTPHRVGPKVELRSFSGKCLRANGGTPPWKNSVTHDEPTMNLTRNWVLWEVEVVEVPENESVREYLSMLSNVSSVSDGMLSEIGSPAVTPRLSVSNSTRVGGSFLEIGSPAVIPRSSSVSNSPTLFSINKVEMDLFENAKVVRLCSHHGKYLHADEDQKSVTQIRDGSSETARWTVEFVPGKDKVIRLKGCNNKYLTASNIPFIRGRKVIQMHPPRLDSTVEWEPIHVGNMVKLQTLYGQFLRANNYSLPLWRNSVTHDVPFRKSTQGWILWSVDILEILSSTPSTNLPQEVSNNQSRASIKRREDTTEKSPPPPPSPPTKVVDGRTIYYKVADEFGNVDPEEEEMSLVFRGNGVGELGRRLEEETGIHDLIVCSRNPLDGKLFPLMLQLPPPNVILHLIVVSADSKVGQDFERRGHKKFEQF